jgi:hypothetical protein
MATRSLYEAERTQVRGAGPDRKAAGPALSRIIRELQAEEHALATPTPGVARSAAAGGGAASAGLSLAAAAAGRGDRGLATALAADAAAAGAPPLRLRWHSLWANLRTGNGNAITSASPRAWHKEHGAECGARACTVRCTARVTPLPFCWKTTPTKV